MPLNTTSRPVQTADGEADPTLRAVRVAAFTGGPKVAGARFRVRQLIEPLRRMGIDIDENYASVSSYPPPIYSALKHLVRPVWAAVSLSQRIGGVVRSHRHDLTFLQREIISAHVTLERFTRRPRVFDVDDSIWLSGDGTAAPRLAQMCDLVICGNSFLAEHFRQWNAAVEILPTAVDTHRFFPGPTSSSDQVVIGWSGAGAGHPPLEWIEPALAKVLAKHKHAKLLVMGMWPAKLPNLKPEQVEFVPWSEDGEVKTFQTMNIGLMPLFDDVASRGKCSYKMLLYMSCGVPVVVSPVGMTRDVLALGEVGFGAENLDQWTERLDFLVSNPALARRLGEQGRDVILNHFGIQQVAVRLASLLRRVAEG